MSSSCPTTDTLSNATFIDACIVANAQNNPPVLAALQTCCGSNLHTIDNGCYTYCNVTTPGDVFQWDFCIGDNLDPNLWADLDFACPKLGNILDFAVQVSTSGTVTSTLPNNVPTGLFTSTTWTPTVTATITASASGKAVTTITFDPKATTALIPVAPLGVGFREQNPGAESSNPVALSTGFLTEGAAVASASTSASEGGTSTQTAASSTSSGGKPKASGIGNGANGALGVSVKKLGVGMIGVLFLGLFV